MKFKAGETVRFLNDTGGGVITRFDDRGLIYVMTEDGFEIPVSEKELILSGGHTFIEPVSEEIRPSVIVKQKAENTMPKKPAESYVLPRNVPYDASVQIVIGFIPEDSGPVFNSILACYLINDSAFLAYYHLGFKEAGEFYYLSSGILEPDTKTYIRSFDQTSISKISDLHVQLILANEGKYHKKEPIDAQVNLNLVNFSKESYFRENNYFEEKALLFYVTKGLSEETIDETEESGAFKDQEPVPNSAGGTRSAKNASVSDTLEVDLHLDELSLQHNTLTPTGMFALQISRFHAAIEEALGKRLHRVVIIHGMGQGTLKMQIRKELQEKYPQFIYQDASFKEYGFGATLVHLTYKQGQ